MVDFREKFWASGKFVAFYCFFESAFKLSFSLSDLFFGHLKNVSSNETRIFIHSVIFVVIGTAGILCSISLFFGLAKKSTAKILWWICFQGIALFHEIFFALELLFLANSYIENKIYVAVVAFALALYLTMQARFFRLILRIYQGIVEEEIASSTPQPTWRVPTISELLGDESDIGRSTPPAHTFRINHDSRLGTSEA